MHHTACTVAVHVMLIYTDAGNSVLEWVPESGTRQVPGFKETGESQH